MSEEKLRSCHKCGVTPTLHRIGDVFGGFELAYEISHCGSRADQLTEEEVIAQWNRIQASAGAKNA